MKVSLARWANEIHILRALSNRPQRQIAFALSFTGFDSGYAMCFMALWLYFAAAVMIGWGIFYYRARNY